MGLEVRRYSERHEPREHRELHAESRARTRRAWRGRGGPVETAGDVKISASRDLFIQLATFAANIRPFVHVLRCDFTS